VAEADPGEWTEADGAVLHAAMSTAKSVTHARRHRFRARTPGSPANFARMTFTAAARPSADRPKLTWLMPVIAVDTQARAPDSAIFIEYYPYQARGDAPKFVLQPDDEPWFTRFVAEAEKLWTTATPCTLSSS
jgi:hypothetical protein